MLPLSDSRVIFKDIEELGAVAHLNTAFKHFMYFSFTFNLLQDKELKALKGPCERVRADFDKAEG